MFCSCCLYDRVEAQKHTLEHTVPIKHLMHKWTVPWLKSENVCRADVQCMVKNNVYLWQSILMFPFSPIYLKYAGHRRKCHPDRHAEVGHEHLRHRQGEWRSWTSWWHRNFCWWSDHPGQHWICSPGLRSVAWSDLRFESGLAQGIETLLRIHSKSTHGNGWRKAFPQRPWTKEQNRCWTVEILRPQLFCLVFLWIVQWMLNVISKAASLRVPHRWEMLL